MHGVASIVFYVKFLTIATLIRERDLSSKEFKKRTRDPGLLLERLGSMKPNFQSQSFSTWPFFPKVFVVLMVGIVLTMTLMVLGCNGSESPVVSHGGTVHDHVSFVDSLRAQGLIVEPAGPIAQPFFPQPGQILNVNGQDVQVFEFGDPGLAEGEAEKISPDGSTVGGSKISWIATPHFFNKGKVIVLYLGTNQTLLDSLNALLGPQFAGG